MSQSADEYFVPCPAERIYPEMPSPDNDGVNLYNGTEMNEIKKSVQEEEEPCIPVVEPSSLIPSAQHYSFNLQADQYGFVTINDTEDFANQRLLDDDLARLFKEEFDQLALLEATSTASQPEPLDTPNSIQTNVADARIVQINEAHVETTHTNGAVEETTQTISTIDASEMASLLTVSTPAAAVPVPESNAFATVASNEYGRRGTRSRKSSLGSRRVSEEVNDTSPTKPGRGGQRAQRSRRATTKRRRSASPEIPQSSNARSRSKRMWEMNTPESKNAMLARRRREEQKAKMEQAEATIKSLKEENTKLNYENEVQKKQIVELLRFKQAHETNHYSTIMMDIMEKLKPVAALLNQLPTSTLDANSM